VNQRHRWLEFDRCLQYNQKKCVQEICVAIPPSRSNMLLMSNPPVSSTTRYRPPGCIFAKFIIWANESQRRPLMRVLSFLIQNSETFNIVGWMVENRLENLFKGWIFRTRLRIHKGQRCTSPLSVSYICPCCTRSSSRNSHDFQSGVL